MSRIRGDRFLGDGRVVLWPVHVHAVRHSDRTKRVLALPVRPPRRPPYLVFIGAPAASITLCGAAWVALSIGTGPGETQISSRLCSCTVGESFVAAGSASASAGTGRNMPVR